MYERVSFGVDKSAKDKFEDLFFFLQDTQVYNARGEIFADTIRWIGVNGGVNFWKNLHKEIQKSKYEIEKTVEETKSENKEVDELEKIELIEEKEDEIIEDEDDDDDNPPRKMKDSKRITLSIPGGIKDEFMGMFKELKKMRLYGRYTAMFEDLIEYWVNQPDMDFWAKIKTWFIV